jgi:Asp-tRNA(Asn)/Glu-tRNA(Gln) amidotransferase A subunit family amidase
MGKDIAHTVEGMDLLEPGFSAQYHQALLENPSARRIRIGRLYLDDTEPKIDQAVDESLRKAGFDVVRLDAGFKDAWNQATRDGTAVAAGGAWLNDHFWADKPGVTERTKAVLALGEITYHLSYNSALGRQRQWQRALRKILRQVDFVALPTINGLPPKVPPFLGSPLFESRILGLQNTVAVNFAGNPAVALPIPVKDKVVPLTSLELIGRPFDEAGLLNAGRLIEASQKNSSSRAE